MHQWMTDSGLTPHVMVDAGVTGVDVPKAHVREGRIVLNIGYDATRHLDLGNDWISIDPLMGNSLSNARLLNPQITHRINLRYRSDVKVGQRILHESRYLYIEKLMNLYERDVELEALCSEALETD